MLGPGALPCLGSSLRPRLHQQGDFAANAIAAGQIAAHLGRRSAQKLLVHLGQLARYDYAYGGTKDGFQIGQRLQNSVRRFVKDQRARGIVALHFGGQRLQPGSPRAGLLRQKADEVELAPWAARRLPAR